MFMYAIENPRQNQLCVTVCIRTEKRSIKNKLALLISHFLFKDPQWPYGWYVYTAKLPPVELPDDYIIFA